MIDKAITNEVKNDLKKRVEYIESKISERDGISCQIKEGYESAKNEGYDVKAIREIISLRKKDKDTVSNEEEIRELYKNILI